MNVIFLDIDGVMNHNFHLVRSKIHKSMEFCPVAVMNLKEILVITNSKIVVSSTWRIGESPESLNSWLFSHYELENYVVGVTSFSGKYDELRGDEIQRYIDSVKGTHREVEKLVIIDDDKDMGHLISRLVHCNDHRGLSNIKKKDEAISLMSS